MFCHLHCHTEYSTLDGFGSPEQWISRTVELGMSSIGITEHGNIDSSIKMSQVAKKNQVKFVCGCEFYICEDMRKKNPQVENRHICIFAQNKQGWQNILQMLSEANLYGYHYKPRIDLECLLRHLDGTIVSSACVASFLGTSWGREGLNRLLKNLKGRFYLEVMPHDLDSQRKWNQTVLEIAGEKNIPIIATNDCHYPRRQDAKLQDICLCVSSSANFNDEKRMKFDSERYYQCSQEEMLHWFRKYHKEIHPSDALKFMMNTQNLIDSCEPFELERIQPDLPIAPIVPIEELKIKGKNEDDFFKSLIQKGLKEKKEELTLPLEVYRERIREELNVLIPKGFAKYFLIVIDIMKFCKESNIMTGPGRGSVGGCLIAWLTGITQVDPLKYDLLFSRFQDPERTDLPDIDCDYEMDRRDEVIQYIKSVYGEQNVSQITTFLTMQGKMALQDVCRVFGIERSEVNEVTKELDESFLTEKTFLESESPIVDKFYRNHYSLVKSAIQIQGTIRGYGKHAAGICISNHNLTEGINGNLAKRQGVFVSNWDKDEGEFMGLMKLDVLGLTALSRIHLCLDMIKKETGQEIDLNKINLEDKKCLKMASRGDVVGVFQLGTPGLRKYCKEIGIDSFKDIYNATALFRPGTLNSGMAEEFKKRKHGEKWKYIHPKLEKFTSETEGIIVYQEQFMLMFKELAGFSWGKCNKVRKVIAKSQGEEALNEYKNDFLNGCLEFSQIPVEKSTQIWDSIVSFSKYAFNKSHSVEYSVISMWDLYLKSRYPGQFYSSCLSYLSEDKRLEILSECVERGFEVILPKMSLSESKNWRCVEKKMIMPFSEIVGIGPEMASKIESCGKKKRKTFFGIKPNLSSVPDSAKKILSSIHFEEESWKPSYKEVGKIQKYFKYNLEKILMV